MYEYVYNGYENIKQIFLNVPGLISSDLCKNYHNDFPFPGSSSRLTTEKVRVNTDGPQTPGPICEAKSVWLIEVGRPAVSMSCPIP